MEKGWAVNMLSQESHIQIILSAAAKLIARILVKLPLHCVPLNALHLKHVRPLLPPRDLARHLLPDGSFVNVSSGSRLSLRVTTVVVKY